MEYFSMSLVIPFLIGQSLKCHGQRHRLNPLSTKARRGREGVYTSLSTSSVTSPNDRGSEWVSWICWASPHRTLNTPVPLICSLLKVPLISGILCHRDPSGRSRGQDNLVVPHFGKPCILLIPGNTGAGKHELAR